jgi:hypothetical protein
VFVRSTIADAEEFEDVLGIFKTLNYRWFYLKEQIEVKYSLMLKNTGCL